MKLDPRALKGLSRFLAPSAGGPVADRALAENLITPQQFHECVEEQNRSGRPLDEILVERGFLRAEDTVRLRTPAVPAEVVAAAADPSLVVGHYILVARVGTGGMAEVWKAWDRSLGRWVALKFLKDEIGHPTQRIEREGRMAGGLTHPGIISIYERGVHAGRPYLVMPFVDGVPPQAPLPVPEAVRLALEIGRALGYAHASGVIHRDVKPGNILVDVDGRAVLADFGLAIPANSETSRWALSGTPEYASPEQVRGDVLDPRTDIYSLGATLYHYLSGRPPFGGGSPEEIVRKVLTESPPPLKAVSGRIRRVVARAMAHDRGRRYASMEDFVRDLAGLQDRFRRRRDFRWEWVAGLVLAGLFSSAVTFAMLRLQARTELRKESDRYLSDGRGRLLAGERLLSDPSTSPAAGAAELSLAVGALRFAFSLGGSAKSEAALDLGRAYELIGQPHRAEASYREVLPDPAAGEALARLLVRRFVEARGFRDWPYPEASRSLSLVDPARRKLYLAFLDRRWADVLELIGTPDPHDDLTLHLGSWAALQTGRVDDAKAWAHAALRHRRLDANAWFVVARAESAGGDLPSSRRAYLEAQRCAPPGWGLVEEVVRALASLK